MMEASGSAQSARLRAALLFFGPVRDAVIRFPASIFSTALTAFIFFMSFFAFVESAAGYAVDPLSPYFVITPVSTTLYQHGLSPELALFSGLIFSFLNFYFQYSSKKLELLLSMSISSASAFFMLMEIVSGSSFSTGLTAYCVIPAYLSLLPATQFSLSSFRGEVHPVLPEAEASPPSAVYDFPELGSGRYDIAIFKKLRIMDSASNSELFVEDAEERVRRIEREIQEFEVVASELERNPAAQAVPGLSLQPAAKVKRVVKGRQPINAEEELADCTVCGSRTPAKEKNCIHCGILRDKYADRHS